MIPFRRARHRDIIGSALSSVMAANPRETEPAPRAVPSYSLLEKRAASTPLAILAMLAVITAAYYAKLPLVVLLVSILLAFVLAPVAELLQRLRLPRALASLIAVLMFMAVLVEVGTVSYTQASNFMRDLPKYSGRIREEIGKLRHHAQEIQK